MLKMREKTEKVTAREMNEAAAILDDGFPVLARDCRKKAVEAAEKTNGILYLYDGAVFKVIKDMRKSK